jgi:hypothetical protein
VTDQQHPSEDLLRARLRRAATEHEPDRTAMLNRIAANRASRPTARGQLVRLAASALAVATVLGLGGVASWAVATHDAPENGPAAPPPMTTPATSGPAKPSASASPTDRPASPPATPARPSASPSRSRPEVRGHPGDTQVEKGSLWSDGSIETAGTGASESTVTLKARADLTELDLTIRVVLTPGLADQGATHDAAAGDITATVERRSGALLYRFVLREGATLPAGTYHFTARYGHDGGTRNAGDDTYEAFAADADRKRPHVYGNFHATTQ